PATIAPPAGESPASPARPVAAPRAPHGWSQDQQTHRLAGSPSEAFRAAGARRCRVRPPPAAQGNAGYRADRHPRKPRRPSARGETRAVWLPAEAASPFGRDRVVLTSSVQGWPHMLQAPPRAASSHRRRAVSIQHATFAMTLV